MTDLDQLTLQIKQATDYQTNKQILQEKTQTDLHLAYNNGLFKVSMELVAFLNAWPSDTIYVTDVYDNPIEADREEFLELCCQHYQVVMNQWHIEHEELKRVRKI